MPLSNLDKLTFTILLHELAGALKRLSSHDSYEYDEYAMAVHRV